MGNLSKRILALYSKKHKHYGMNVLLKESDLVDSSLLHCSIIEQQQVKLALLNAVH